MPRLLLRFVAITVLLFAVSSATPVAAQQQVTVRGRLDRAGPYGLYPAVGVAVTVNSRTIGRSGTVYAGSDGMYYLYVPPGPYLLEVWTVPEQSPMIFEIVVPAVPNFDIAPIQVP